MLKRDELPHITVLYIKIITITLNITLMKTKQY